MASFKTTKKHHRHINNPFPFSPKTIPFIQGDLSFNPQTVPSHQVYQIGDDFQLNWSGKGGYVSICHNSNPSRSIWSTVPGRAFISTATVDTEVEESRGSFVIKDGNIHLICSHQSIEEIRSIQEYDGDIDQDLLFFGSGMEQGMDREQAQSPAVLIRGRIFSTKTPVANGEYCVVFGQKNSNQVGFRIRFGKPIVGKKLKLPTRGYIRCFIRKMRRLKRRLRVEWSGYLLRRRVAIAISTTQEEKAVMKNAASPFNRIFITYSSEKSERFYGFGEQFSHMDFKGKKVPILVQEQGIGRGDQPITFAANLVSYRAGGDECTTYAPSPYYMTSKMRSIYLEGYNYSVFDLSKPDCVQIQMHGNTIEGRILNGNSPAELIECFTETIGRPQELPEWIISGAVVGMQGGTDTVHHIWKELNTQEPKH